MKKTVTNPRTWIDWQTQPRITHVGTRFRRAQKKKKKNATQDPRVKWVQWSGYTYYCGICCTRKHHQLSRMPG